MRFATRALAANLASVLQDAACRDRVTDCQAPSTEVPPEPCDESSEPPPPPAPECGENSEPQPLVVSSCDPDTVDCEPVREARSSATTRQAIRAQMRRAARRSSRRR